MQLLVERNINTDYYWHYCCSTNQT